MTIEKPTIYAGPREWWIGRFSSELPLTRQAERREAEIREFRQPYLALLAAPAQAFTYLIMTSLWVLFGNDNIAPIYNEISVTIVTVAIAISTIALIWVTVRHFEREWLRIAAIGSTALLSIFVFANLYVLSDLRIGDCMRPPEYDEAIYFSVVTFTTLGYGDIVPVGINRLLATTEAILGYIYLGMLVGLLTNFRSSREAVEN